MAIVKRVNSPYTIQTVTATDGITLNSGYVTVTGNLNVLGSTTAIETNNTSLKDNIIVLNDGEAGAGVTLGTAGIQIDRGTSANVTLRWNEANGGTWQITGDGTNYANIAASSLTTANLSLQDSSNPYLNANLNLHGYTIVSNVGNINFAGNLQINNAPVSPTSVSGATVLYASTPSGGTSGLYVVNESATNQELVTKTRAFGYSLIL